MPWRISAKVKADPICRAAGAARGRYGAEDSALRAVRRRRHSLRRLAAASRQPVGAAARRRQIRRQEATSGNRRAGPPVAGVARADGRASRRQRRFRRKSNSAPSRSCWAAVRCRIFPPVCRPMPNPGPIDQLEFRAPGATRVTLGGSNAQAGSFAGALSVDFADPDALVTWLQGRGEVAYRSQKPLRLRGDVTVAAGPRCDRSHEGRDRRRRRRGTGRGFDGDRRLAVRRRAEGGTSRSRCRHRAGAFAGGPAGGMAGRGAALARYRPRHHRPVRNCGRSLARSATAPKIVRAGAAEDRRGRQRDDGRRRQFRSRQHDRKTGAEFERGVARPDHRVDRAAGAGAGGAAQCDGRRSRPGAPQAVARSRQEPRSRPTAPAPAPCSISMRPCSRASSRSRQSPSSWPCTASISRRSGAASSRSNPDCRRGRAVRCWPRWGSIARSRRAMARRNSRVR